MRNSGKAITRLRSRGDELGSDRRQICPVRAQGPSRRKELTRILGEDLCDLRFSEPRAGDAIASCSSMPAD
jgi:hypothetical protein